jgi:phage-related protein
VPATTVVYFQDEDGSVPLIEWLDDLPAKAQDKCLARLARLEMLGHELRRPEADFLREGIYELRVSLQGQQYRMLYFFHGKVAAVISHGLIKEQKVPPREIDRAVARKKQFLMNPKRYSFIPERRT